MDEDAKASTGAVHPASLEYHNKPSPYFRVVHADGAFGGPTPSGRQLHFIFYNERPTIPTSVRHELAPEAGGLRVGKEIRAERIGKAGFEREVEVDVRMDVEVAANFYRWLRGHLVSMGVDVESLDVP